MKRSVLDFVKTAYLVPENINWAAMPADRPMGRGPITTWEGHMTFPPRANADRLQGAISLARAYAAGPLVEERLVKNHTKSLAQEIMAQIGRT